MTYTTNNLDFQIAAETPRHQLMFRLEVHTNNGWRIIGTQFGAVKDRKTLRLKIEEQCDSWQYQRVFGDCPMRIREFHGAFTTTPADWPK